MAADLATLAVRIDASQARAELGGLEGALGKVGKVAAALGVTLGAASLLKKFVDETSQAQYAVAQLEARLKSTGGVAGQSLAQLQAFAGEMQRLTTYSDEAVQGAQALLLTFTKIRGDVFPGATKAALNLATAMGTDLRGAAIQIGKALQDPEQGLTALRRSGVSFTEAQQTVIKSLFATGQEAKAQQLILAELEVQFGGAAEAARDTLGGALAGLKNAWGELFEASRDASSGMIDALNGITAFLPKFGAAFSNAIGGMRLMYVDLVTHIQEGNARIYADTAKMLQLLAGAFSAVGLAGSATQLRVKAAELTLEADTLSAAFQAWKKEQYDVIAGVQTLTKATAALVPVADQARVSALEGAIADERAARAKDALTDAAKRYVDLYERTAGKMWKPTIQGRTIVGEGTGIVGPGALGAQATAESYKREMQVRRQILKDEQVWEAGEEIKHQREIERIRENFIRQFQQTVANGISDMLTRGLSSWRDFFDSIKQMFLKLVADMAAQKLAEKMLGSTDAKGKFAAAVTAATTGYDVGRQVGGAKGVAAGTASGAAQGAAIGFTFGGPAGAVIGGTIGAVTGFVSSLFGVSQHARDAAAAAREQAKREAELAEQHRLAAIQAAAEAEARRRAIEEQGRLLTEELAVRRLRAQGLEEEADALALLLQQQRELAEAVKAGLAPEVLAELARTQGLETQKREADLAARRAEEAARRGAEAAGAMPDPSGVVATRQLSTVTSGQGDRMVDELRSSRIHLSNIDRFVRIIADNTGGLRQFSRTVDSALSNALASASAYSGNALVTA